MTAGSERAAYEDRWSALALCDEKPPCDRMDYGDQFWTENFNNALPVKQCKALRITAAGLFFFGQNRILRKSYA